MPDELTFRHGGWRYLVPNFLTATNLAFGVLACFYSIHGKAYMAGWFILLAVCFDRFDGAAARLLKATGKFGIEFDSLADLVSFGVAPAMMVFASLIQDPSGPYRDPGWERSMLFAACGFYVLATAFRLARYNVDAGSAGTRIYFGLPSPAGAAMVVTGYLTLLKYSSDPTLYQGWVADLPVLGGATFGDALRPFYPIVVALTALLMVMGLKVPRMNPPGKRFQDTYLIINMILIYVFTFVRILPEFLLLAAIQVLIVSVTFHFFWASAREASKRPILEAMSMASGESESTESASEAATPD